MGMINIRNGKEKYKPLRILLDSGTSATIVNGTYTKKLRTRTDTKTKWKTKAGTFYTDATCKVQLVLPEFDEQKLIEYKVHVDNITNSTTSRYDMIIGTDLMEELGITLDFKNRIMTWEGATAPMKTRNWSMDKSKLDYIYESNAIEDLTICMDKILDSDYHKANINKVTADAQYLTPEQQKQLNFLLKRYEYLFDGRLGRWDPNVNLPVDFELKDDAKPYHAKPYPIPQSLEAATRKEVERLCSIGVLRKVNRSKWAALTFIRPKKNGRVRFLSDFRELNKRIKRKPFPLPKIQDLLQKLEGFTYATSLDLNMGYYHIQLTPNARRLCTIVMPWGKYEYLRLPMGVANSPDIFQEHMSELMAGLEFVRVYIDDILCITKGDYDDHLRKLEQVFMQIEKANLRVNAEKSFFAKDQVEYLGFLITRQGIRPLARKVDAIHNIQPPKTRKELRRFIGVVNYYRDMWPRRSDILAPLSKLVSDKVPWKWTDREQKAFELMKKVISKEVLLSYPDFSKPFVIHTDASHQQLGAVITQNNRPIAFYSRKLNSAQTNYTTTERELLSIVETLKEFKNILFGQKIIIYTDHQNLTYAKFNTERVIRWRLIIEEFHPDIRYIKGSHNLVADALSRMSITNQSFDLNYTTYAEAFDIDDLPKDAFPLKYSTIDTYQQQDPHILKSLQRGRYTTDSFSGGKKTYTLVVYKEKIVIPQHL